MKQEKAGLSDGRNRYIKITDGNGGAGNGN